MRRLCLSFALLGVLSLPLTAQVSVSVKTLNAAGIALVRKNSTVVKKNFAANQTFTTYGRLFHYEQSPYTYVGTTVSPPVSFFGRTYNRFGISNRAFVRKGSGHKGLFMTGDTTGNPGTQKYQVSITTKKSTNLMLSGWVYGYIYDNSTAGFKLSGGGLNKSWAWSKPGYGRTTEQLKLTVNGTVNLTLEATGNCTPGPGSNRYYDGFFSSVYLTVIETGTGSFTPFGKTCGTPVIGGKGTPTKSTFYTITLDKAHANAATSFLFGTSKDRFHFLKLPLPLDYMNAPGCALNVGFIFPIARIADASGHAEYSIYLSPYHSGPVYGQWVTFNKNANAAGITLTQGGEIKF